MVTYKLFPLAFCFLLACAFTTSAQQTPPPPDKQPPVEEGKAADKRTELNLMGKTDTASGESRRNENVQFNLIDNNLQKELNVRVGATSTIVREFAPANGYFGAEYGTPPKISLVVPAVVKAGTHGTLRYAHLNSALSARSFFQVGAVKPARENDYGFNFSAAPWRNAKLFIEAGQDKIRGSVNGNVLVPTPDERTPLAADPAVRAVVARLLSAYPAELPNRTDINPRALNTNAPQTIDGNSAQIRLDQTLSKRDQLLLQYQFTGQSVEAFQLVGGQNPNTNTKSHLARIVWTRNWDATTVSHLSASYDRVTSRLDADDSSVGPFVLLSGLSILGPEGIIPVDRAQNQLRYAGQLRKQIGAHNVAAGFSVLRRQLNGFESDAHRGVLTFTSDFGRDTITNLRLGIPSQYLVSIGNIHRGYRNWEAQFYVGDDWKTNRKLTLQYSLRYQPTLRVTEVNGLDTIPYDCDCNNVAGTFGFAYNLPPRFGVLRAAYGTHYGEIFPATYQQVRFSPPNNFKVVVTAPNLLNPLGGVTQGGQLPNARPTLYQLDPELSTPYAHQYNLSWEPDWTKRVKLQLGYVGSRAHKLLVMWYTNRAQPVAGIPQTTATINERRRDPRFADIRLIVNGSDGYYDAARVSASLPAWRGLTMDAAYWFSKAIDLGADYLGTAYDNDSRRSRSQSEFDTHGEMRGLSAFDQTHAFLWRTNYAVPPPPFGKRIAAVLGGWNLSAVALLKTGTPFNLGTGSDAPGFGNVDGNSSDRPNILDPSILGRTIGNPNTSQQLLPRAAFGFIRPGEQRGNVGRNVFRKGPIHNVNAALSRAFAVYRDLRLTFRAESVNLFNTPQFAEPGFDLANPNFGAITNTLNEGRTFRFALQLGW